MSDEEFDEKSYQAYEDELYGENSDDSDNGVDSEIEEALYGQVHYSFSLPDTTEEKDVIEVTSQGTNASYDLAKVVTSVQIIGRKEAVMMRGQSLLLALKKTRVLLKSKNWDLDEKDLDEFSDNIGHGRRSVSRYYKGDKKSMHLRCHNCHEKGHAVSDCPMPKKISKCYLCGTTGHVKRFCPNELCFNCDEPGHQSRSCRQPRRRQFDQCRRCYMNGHFKSDCPDRWRQFHRTIKVGRIVCPRNSSEAPKSMYCYNCSAEGHYGHECFEERMEPRSSIPLPYIVHYDGCPSPASKDNKSRDRDEEGGHKTHWGGDGKKGDQYNRRRSWPEHQLPQSHGKNHREFTNRFQHKRARQDYVGQRQIEVVANEPHQSMAGKQVTGLKRGYDDNFSQRGSKKKWPKNTVQDDEYTQNDFQKPKKKKNKSKKIQNSERIVQLIEDSMEFQSDSWQSYQQPNRLKNKNSRKSNANEPNRVVTMSEHWDESGLTPTSRRSSPGYSHQQKNPEKFGRGFLSKKRPRTKGKNKHFTM